MEGTLEHAVETRVVAVHEGEAVGVDGEGDFLDQPDFSEQAVEVGILGRATLPFRCRRPTGEGGVGTRALDSTYRRHFC